MIRPRLLLASDEAALMACVLQPWASALGLRTDRNGRVDAAWLAWALAHRELGISTQGAATLLQGLRAVDVLQMLKAGPDRPRVRDLIRGGELVYDRRDHDEHWQTWNELVGQIPAFGALARPGRRAPARDGKARGDCEDLGAAWSAELVVDDWDRDAVPVAYESRPGLSHVVVRSRRYGDIDPSRLAGMGRP